IYSVPALSSGHYRVSFSSSGFSAITLPVIVTITETSAVDIILKVAGPRVDENFVVSVTPFVQTEGPQLGRIVDSRPVSELPLAARNFTQLLGLSTGTSTALPDNGTIGRNAQKVSVNGARFTQNNFQINGIDANGIGGNGVRLADPAP